MNLCEGTVHGIAGWRRRGPGRTLICLHGIGSHGDSFRTLLPSLPEDWDVIAWAAPGYDGSVPLGVEWPTEADYAHALNSFLCGLSLDRVTLLGHSLGTLMAARYAADHPEKVEALVLAACATGHGAPVGQLSEAAARRLRDLETQGPEEFAAVRAPRLLARPAQRPEAAESVARNMARVRMPGYGQAVRMLASGRLTDSLARVTCPTAILWGTGDVVTPRAQSEQAAAALGGVPITEIADSGHASYVETPGAFAQAMTKALSEMKETTT